VVHAVKAANPNKIGQALADAKPDEVMKDVTKAVKDVDPQKAASEALKSPEATRAAEALKDQVANVVAKDSLTSPPTTTSPPKPTTEETGKKVGDALESTRLAKILKGKGVKDIADAIRGVTPKKVVEAVQSTDVKKVTETVAEDTTKIATALQDTVPKDIAQVLNGGMNASKTAEKVKDALHESGASKVLDAVKGADASKLGDAVQAVQEAAGAVREVGAGKVAKSLQDKSAGDLAGALNGAKKDAVQDVIKHPTKDKLEKALDAIGNDKEPGDDDSETSAPSSSSWPLMVLFFIAVATVCGWFSFRRLTRPTCVGSPILSEPNGTDMTVMPQSWMGMGGARDFMSHQPAPGFQRF
jgi:hypothetical protein